MIQPRQDRSDPERELPVAARARRQWLLYGAYGYTGRLLAAEALARGHRPVLAGRDAAKLRALVEEHEPRFGPGLCSRVFSLAEPAELRPASRPCYTPPARSSRPGGR